MKEKTACGIVRKLLFCSYLFYDLSRVSAVSSPARQNRPRIRKMFMTPTAIPCEQEEAIVLPLFLMHRQAFSPLFLINKICKTRPLFSGEINYVIEKRRFKDNYGKA
ncbi:hypothetical protein KHU1_0351 [Bacillus amyloliquefaciens KHG19]|nr:hypothetical protein KHU1_0351 [Bacillus amyloliquefaciens KHG19]